MSWQTLFQTQIQPDVSVIQAYKNIEKRNEMESYGRESWATKSILFLSRNSWLITQGASGITSSTHLRTKKKTYIN